MYDCIYMQESVSVTLFVYVRVCGPLIWCKVILQQEGSLKMTFQKQGLLLKRPLEAEEGAANQQQYLARLHDLQAAADASLSDFTKPLPSTGLGMCKL